MNKEQRLTTALENAVHVLTMALPLFNDTSDDEHDSKEEVQSVIAEAQSVLEES